MERSIFAPSYPSSRPLITLGDHILKKRLDLRLEQKQVAKIIGTDKCSIANWEHNRSEPRTRYLPKIIDFLGYTPKDLFTANTLPRKFALTVKFTGLPKNRWQINLV
ncbi:MAG: helix-turn-helix transcriptional regulator [Phycisphaerales bacterium]